jgi:acyl-coenzyme A synthetase/AMP-(fatty) acid ligase
MANLLAFNDITQGKFSSQHTVAVFQQQTISYEQFLNDVQHLYQQITALPQKNWALYHEETYPFAVGLTALLCAKKHVYIPGNITETTLNTLTSFVDGFIGDMPNATLPIITQTDIEKAIALPSISSTSPITIFTSGSTGEAKAIEKTLLQFEHELTALEQCWGSKLDNCAIVSTVSHQHIYGLLFRVLWPIASGRLFYSERALDSALAIKEAINSEDGAVWIASPAHLKRLHVDLPWQAAQKKLKLIFSSGGPLPEDAARALKAWHKQSATEVYGSSETGGIAHREQYSVNTDWQPLPNVTIKVDEDTRLLIKSPHIDNNHWYETDDSATINADGSFTLNGRLDRIIKLEEKRLSLIELEQAIRNNEWVEDVYCTLLPKTTHRDILAAAVVLNHHGNKHLSETSKNDFIKALKNTLTNHFELSLLPRKWRFIDQIPTNEQSKINRVAIQGLFTNNE